MNKQRRTCIEEIIPRIEAIRGELAFILDEEQEAFDNLPEGIQSSKRGEKMEEAINTLQDADISLDEVQITLSEIIEVEA